MMKRPWATPAANMLNRERPFAQKFAPMACLRQGVADWEFSITRGVVCEPHFIERASRSGRSVPSEQFAKSQCERQCAEKNKSDQISRATLGAYAAPRRSMRVRKRLPAG